MSTRVWLNAMGLVLAAAMLAGAMTRMQETIDPAKYAKVKAAMILNFVRYTTWPADRFEDNDDGLAPVVITLLGEDEMEDDLHDLMHEEKARGRRIEVRRVKRPEPDPRTRKVDKEKMDEFYASLRESHLLFIARSEEKRYLDVLEAIAEDNVLTTSDIQDFAREGGMLGLAVRQGRVAFDANAEVIERSDLEVSSKLLRLANIVKTKEREAP